MDALAACTKQKRYPSSLWLRRFMGGALALTIAFFDVGLSAQTIPENKAAGETNDLTRDELLGNLLRFVRFANEDARSELTFCALAADTEMKTSLSQRVVRGKPVKFIVPANDAEMGECDILYHNRRRTDATQSLVQKLTGKPILLVGDDEGACAAGFSLCLAPNAKFGANLDALQRSGLRVSSQLLQRATSAKK